MQDSEDNPRNQDYDRNGWSDEKTDHHTKQDLPQSLRVGPPGYTQDGSQEMSRPNANTTNPYLQRQGTGASDVKESSAAAWGGFGERPPQPAEAPPPPPLPKGMRKDSVYEYSLTYSDTPPPSEQLANLSVAEPSTNPWQPALDDTSSTSRPTPPPINRQDSGNQAWAVPPPARQAPAAPEPALIDLEDEGNGSPAWDEDSIPSPTIQEMPADDAPERQQILADQHAWDEDEGRGAQQNQPPAHQEPTQQSEGWNLIDHESTLDMSQQSGVVGADGTILEEYTNSQAPVLPPRPSQEMPPQQPPRPTIATNNTGASSIASPGAAAVKQQRKETYEIKKITWHDVTADENPRVSPILVQNANGPCPLLALVNALTLSTPASVETALVETLRSREQVSLGLLLDAVFDELMSGRRGEGVPDVAELYSFLLALHTGMNVNPRFFPPAPSKSAADVRNSMTHVHPAERDSSTPGTFEETREMRLYSTFSIPLIHGWLPDRDSPAYAALRRSAQSYEDAQNLFFHEEELEDKLQREGLSFQEQGTLEDIATIKAFFATAATQLTPFGLETITTSLQPGAVAILFRNDHFSTLYRHPDTLQLLQLVTDMGYAGHEEVVWESLIDVNGEHAEFFSGDFRLVGGAPSSPTHSRSRSNENWTPVPVRTHSSQNQQNFNVASTPEPPHSPNIEQEDHDLALALQLQEEEEERHRTEQARRRRETELSQQYIEQQGQNNVPVSTRGGGGRGRIRGSSGSTRGAPEPRPEPRPVIPPRRNGPQGQPIGGRPIDPEAGVDAPPPSYEQAANQAAYVPPVDHPAHPNASPNNRRMSAYIANSSALGSSPALQGVNRRGTTTLIGQYDQGAAGVGGRRRNTSGGLGLSQQQQEERSKDCIMM